ncbi:OprO/OprP family phosphate-selective porin [Roseomonas sp. BN140053]|uniref:OprO/OprP family phosphate-selective porin n=1 Tax=Roseomonas sp. BN140053 TaxID=3391898 RepID=UPI0039EB65E0
MRRSGLFRAALLATLGTAAAAAPAAAQDGARIEALERQLREMQAELSRLRREVAARPAEPRPGRPAETATARAAPRGRAPAATAQARSPADGGPPTATAAQAPSPAAAAGPSAARTAQARAPTGGSGGQPAASGVQSGSGQVAQDTDSAARSATTAGADAAGPGRVSFPSGRPTFTSGDGRFSAAVGAQIQYDIGGYIRDRRSTPDQRGTPHLNTFGENLRRGRLPFVFRYDDVQLNVTPDFGGSPDGDPSLYEASLNWTPLRALMVTAGYFKPWLTLGDATSSNDFLFLERPSVVEIARSIAAGDGRAAFGARWAEERWFLSGYLTGGNYGSQSSSEATPQQTGAAFRLAGRPVAAADWDLHLGLSGSLAFDIGRTAGGQNITLQDRPELRIDQNRLISTGAIPADGAHEWGPEFALRWRNFLLQGEYIRIGVDQSRSGTAPRPDLRFEGGYAEASWVLTGEARSYSTSGGAFEGIRPRQPFSLRDGGLGAFELVGRYSVVDLNDRVTRGRAAAATGGVFGGRQEVLGLGLNWYPSNNLRFMLDWNNVSVDRLNAAGTTQIGQRFDEVALRAQAAF